MFISFNTALSALKATSTAIDVVGNNLANLNTTAYKGSSVSFQDMVTQSLGAGLSSSQVGFGTAPPLAMRQFTQGAVQASGGTLDAAIKGDGFFVVRDASSGATLYTRAGDFRMDGNGNLQTLTGQSVQGWMASNGVVSASGSVTDITLPIGQLSKPVPTTAFSLNMNLNAAAVAGSANGQFSTSIQAVDSLGRPLVMTVNFTKDADAPNTWSYQVTIPGDATADGTPGTPTELLSTPGTLEFDSNGVLTSPAAADGAIQIDVTGLSDGASDLSITWNLFDPATGTPNLTQIALPSAVSGNAQDGKFPAELLGVGLADGGLLMGQYSNGSQVVLAQLAVASIRNPDSLVAVGQNNYQIGADSALPVIGAAGTGGRGDVVGGALEGSTVDIATEFTNLIRFQRAYQANGKVVTTVDQMSQETISLKQG
jgi:flagellar hook protein FlgE